MFSRLDLFQKYCELDTRDLSKQQKLDTDPKAKQQINFTENLERDGNATVFFIAKEARETKLDFSNETVTVLQFYFLSI